MNTDKVLIVCDRGVLDNKAYMSQEEFDAVMRFLGTNEVYERDHYDAVIHMVTAANGAEHAYTCANNAARTETIEEAIAIDNKLIAAWTGHPHLRVIDNSDSFDNKISRVIAEIAALLDEPEPLEIERKYLIKYPDILRLEDLPNCKKVDMVQAYLKVRPDGTETRIRQRGQNGTYLCYMTEKRRLTDATRVEVDHRISIEEYVALLADTDPERRPIRKTRYCLTENGRYYEIDIYPEWKKQAILEIELNSEDEEVVFPEKIKVIRDVTGVEAYTNFNMAKHMPEE
jgi:CYTH domain-containing protein